MKQGGRLFTPRSTRAMIYFEEFENLHISSDAMFQYAKDQSRQAIGLSFKYNIGDSTGSIVYRCLLMLLIFLSILISTSYQIIHPTIITHHYSDGIEVSSHLISNENLEWASGYPMTDIENQTCISWSGHNSGSLKIKNTACDSTVDSSESDMVAYYNKNSDTLFDETYLLRGYLCETRAIHTIEGSERMASFNFDYYNLHLKIA